MLKVINQEILSHIESFKLLNREISNINALANKAIQSIERGGKIILFGNGGSAADAQHIAAELVGRYKESRKGLPAISLATDSSALTSIGNDFGYESVFQRQLEALVQKEDLVIGISTSDDSKNVINALKFARSLEITTCGFSGDTGGLMKNYCDINIIAPSDETPRIQEMHIFIGHTICQLIDSHFSNY